MSSSITALSILSSAANTAPSTTPTPTLTVLGFAAANPTTTTPGSIFGTLADQTATSAIQNILNSAATQQTETGVYDNIANYLSALQSGQIKPTTSWQTDAAYLQQTGQPFVVTISNGQPQVTPEAQADLSQYTPPEQKLLTEAMQTLSTMAQKIQANATNAGWLTTLQNVEPALIGFRTGSLLPQAGWQSEAADYAATGTPFEVGLSSTGTVIVENQFESDFPNANSTDQATLSAAVGQLRTALQTGITPLAWEAQAYIDAQAGQDYYLAVDSTTGDVVVKTNTAANIVPAFLQTPPYPDIGADTPWLQQAATLIQQGTGFYLDVGSNGQIIVRQNNGQGINTYNQPRTQAVQNPIVSLLT